MELFEEFKRVRTHDIKLCIDVNSFRNKLRGVLLDKFKREE